MARYTQEQFAEIGRAAVGLAELIGGRPVQEPVFEGAVEVSELDGSSSTLLRAPARATFGHGRASSSALGSAEAGRLRAAAITTRVGIYRCPGGCQT